MKKEIVITSRFPLLRMPFYSCVLLCVLLILFYLVPLIFNSETLAADFSIRQLIVFPFIFYFFAKLEICGLRIPKMVLLCSAAALLIAVGVAHYYKGIEAPHFLVARFGQDQFEIESRIFWKKLDRELGKISEVRAIRYSQTVTNPKEARNVLKSNDQSKAIVWGNRKWVNIFFRGLSSKTLGSLGLGLGKDTVSKLRVILSLPKTALSFQPERETIRFLALFLSSVFIYEQKNVSSGDFDPKLELDLLTAAMMRSPWVSYHHQALSWLELGNWYLRASLSGGEYEDGELRCAVEAYRRAMGLFISNNNRELFSTLANNHAIALYLQSLFEKQNKAKRANINDLLERAAKSPKRESSGRRSWDIAARNVVKMRVFRQQKTGKQRKKLVKKRPKSGI